MKRLKSVLALALSIVFALSVFIPGALAQGSAAFSQEKAVEKIKGIFDTAGFDEFNIRYMENKDRKTWNLSWSNSEEPYGSLDATVDADTGNILNIDMDGGYDPDQKSSFIPKVSEEEARKIAEEFAKKHQPDEFAKTIYREAQEPIYRPLTARYQQDYNFNFVRVIKDIPVEGDGFNVSVNGATGEVQNYSFSWSYDGLPSADKVISREEAEKIFKEKAGLKLAYKRYYNYETKEDNVKLVYTIDRPYSLLIDATTGEFLDDANYSPYDRGGMGSADLYMKSAAAQPLTHQEQKEVDATNNCITKEAAVKVLQKYVTIPEGYEQNYANLYEDYDNPGQKVWSMSWSKKTDDDEGYGSVNAQVDAVSSELLSFNIWDDSRSNNDFTQKYDRTAAQKLAEDFLKKLQPEKANSVKLEETVGAKYPDKIREHYFSFTRLVGSIPYLDNGFSVSVDSVTGEILSYNMRWQDRDFPKADGVVSKQDAEAGFLKDIGLELCYTEVYRDDEEQESKFYLVYKLKSSNSYIFDAFDMKPLDYGGKPIEKQPDTVFSDIKGHWAENDIQLLVDMGVIRSGEDKFHPDDNMDQGDFIKLLTTATGLGPVNNIIVYKTGVHAGEDSESVQDYIDAAIKAGIAKQGEIDAQKPLPREKMAAFMVRALGYDKVASISDIYSIPAEDAAAVAGAYKGHAAIAMGLGLITGEDGKFDPQGSVTRAQAAVVLVRMLQLYEQK